MFRRKNSQPLQQSAAITMALPSAAISEQFRVLRTNIRFSLMDTSLRSLAITSASNNVGKSTVAINLAITIAQQGKRVLLADCDFRRPTVHEHFALPNVHGLTDLLNNPTGVVQDYVQATRLADLSVLTGGPTPPNPAELLSSRRMIHLEKEFEEQFDLIIYDTPPLLGFADAQIVAGRAEGTIFVVQHGVSTKADTEKSSEALKRVNANVLGAVYNRVPVNAEDANRHHYYQTKVNPISK